MQGKTTDSIFGLVHRLFRGPEIIVASPATIQMAIEKGEPIEEVPQLSVEESIEKLFTARKAHALEVAAKLPLSPSSEAPILYLYDEIRQAILFGMNGTAITLCGMLVEFVLKYASYTRENAGSAKFDSEAWQEFEGKLTLKPAIDRAEKNGLLDKEKASGLRSFAEEIRNTYSHFNIQKITKHAVFKNVGVKHIETGAVEIRDVPASVSPSFQILAKSKIDEQGVFGVLNFVDRVVRHLLRELEKNPET